MKELVTQNIVALQFPCFAHFDFMEAVLRQIIEAEGEWALRYFHLSYDNISGTTFLYRGRQIIASYRFVPEPAFVTETGDVSVGEFIYECRPQYAEDAFAAIQSVPEKKQPMAAQGNTVPGNSE